MIFPLPEIDVTLQSPVRTHRLPLPSVTLTVPSDEETVFEFLWEVIFPLVIPVQDDDPLRLTVAVESLPTRIFPEIA